MDGARRASPVEAPPAAPAAPPADVAALLTPPSDLPADQQACWALYAKSAVEQRTLVPATVAGFRELCEQFAFKAAISARIQKAKAGSKKSDGLLRHYVKLAQRLDSTLARFKLTSFGKPADGQGGARKTSAPSPWAAIGGKA
jgi:hypothetical protein